MEAAESNLFSLSSVSPFDNSLLIKRPRALAGDGGNRALHIGPIGLQVWPDELARNILLKLDENKGTRVSRVSRVSGLLRPPSTLIIGLTPA